MTKQELIKRWKDNRWLFLLSGWLLGVVTVGSLQRLNIDKFTLLYDLVPEALGIIFTVAILDRLADIRMTEQLKQQLIQKASGSAHEFALNAIDELREKNWLYDGTLKECFFKRAYLQKADLSASDFERAILRQADLTAANLTGTNLKNADLYRAELSQADLGWADLRGANLNMANLQGVRDLDKADFDTKTILPDGNFYSPDIDLKRFTDIKHENFWNYDSHLSSLKDKQIVINPLIVTPRHTSIEKLRLLLTNFDNVSRVKSAASLRASDLELKNHDVNLIFIDPISLGLRDAGQFILMVK